MLAAQIVAGAEDAALLKCLLLFGAFELLGLLVLWRRLLPPRSVGQWPGVVCRSLAILLRTCHQCRLPAPSLTCYLKALGLGLATLVLAGVFLALYTLAFLSHGVDAEPPLSPSGVLPIGREAGLGCVAGSTKAPVKGTRASFGCLSPRPSSCSRSSIRSSRAGF